MVVLSLRLRVEAAHEAEPFRNIDRAVLVVRVVCAVCLLPVLDGLPVRALED